MKGWRGTDEGGMLKEAGTENWLRTKFRCNKILLA